MELSATTEYYEYDSTNGSLCNTIDINEFSRSFLPPFYYIIFVVSVLGNGAVLLVMYKFEKLNTVTNIFLINLVASNIIFTITLPFQAVYHSHEWIFGEALCKLVNSAYFIGFYSSILFLTLMTFDRYLAVVHCVVANKQRSSCYAVALSIIVWSVSLIASLDPFFHFSVQEDQLNGLLCEDFSESQWKVFSLYKQFIFFFIFPFAVFVYCYFRIILTVMYTRMVKKYRTVRLIFITVLMFFACWSPYNIILMIYENKDPYPCDDSLDDYAIRITNNIARLYFCINTVFTPSWEESSRIMYEDC